jgi:hypothetical protein
MRYLSILVFAAAYSFISYFQAKYFLEIDYSGNTVLAAFVALFYLLVLELSESLDKPDKP